MVMFMNTDPMSRLMHPIVLHAVDTSSLEERLIVGSLLLVMSIELYEKGDDDAAILARHLGEALRP